MKQPPVLVDALWDVVNGRFVPVSGSVKGLGQVTATSRRAFSRAVENALPKEHGRLTVRYLGAGVIKPKAA